MFLFGREVKINVINKVGSFLKGDESSQICGGIPVELCYINRYCISFLPELIFLIVKEGFRNMEPKGKVIFVRVVLG